MDEERAARDLRVEHGRDQHDGQGRSRRDAERVLLRVFPFGVDGGDPAGRGGSDRCLGGVLCGQHPQRVRHVSLHHPLLRRLHLPLPLLHHAPVCLRGPAGHRGRVPVQLPFV